MYIAVFCAVLFFFFCDTLCESAMVTPDGTIQHNLGTYSSTASDDKLWSLFSLHR